MKVSASVLCSALAALYLAAHLPSLAPSLEDIDSINFALGLREFDVAKHQPHPPGYPVYIALGRASLAAIGAVAPSLPQVRAEALALAIWSAVFGAIAVAAAFLLFRALEPLPPDDRAPPGAAWQESAVWSAALLAVVPLFWLSGLRPMSDMVGLALALVAQSLLLRGLNAPRALVAGALTAGVAAGVRVQAAALTLPLLVVVLISVRRRHGPRIVAGSLIALAAGVLLWAVPLVTASGGIDGYLQALGTQAGEDFVGVDMLWSNPTPRRLAFALFETFVQPWHSMGLFIFIAVAAALGAIASVLRHRTALLMMAVAFGPYAIFHLLLQDTVMVRYALPLLVPVCWLAVAGADALAPVGKRTLPLAIAVRTLMVIVTAIVSIPVGIVYGREPHPAFRAIDDMDAVARTAPPAAIYSHFALRRPLQAASPSGVRVVEPRRSYEWLGLVEYWRSGGMQPVWFLADPRRTDLALIDPQSRKQAVTQYRWRVGDRLELAGTRPNGVDWYRFQPPGWFAAEGWSLTPEAGGITRVDGSGPDRRPIEAFVRRSDEPMHMVVGGRHLGAASGGAVAFDLTLDGMSVERWELDPAREGLNFLRFIDLPNGLRQGSGPYARLTIAAQGLPSGTPAPPVGIRQFDIQPANTLIYGFGEGWHEAEYDNATGMSWRWSSDRSVLRVAPYQTVRISLRGESPLNYIDSPPHVRVTAGGREVGAFDPNRDFDWSVVVPGELVTSSGGAIAIETDRVYLPGQAEGTADERRLGLRLFEIDVTPAVP
jgi:hypothetical protein